MAYDFRAKVASLHEQTVTRMPHKPESLNSLTENPEVGNQTGSPLWSLLSVGGELDPTATEEVSKCWVCTGKRGETPAQECDLSDPPRQASRGIR